MRLLSVSRVLILVSLGTLMVAVSGVNVHASFSGPPRIFVLRALIPGSGAAGSGFLFNQMFAYMTDNVQGGGAFNGTLTLHASLGYDTGLFRITTGSVTNLAPNQCKIELSGTVTRGSFLGQPVDTITYLDCQILGAIQPVILFFTIGAAVNPLFVGHGSGLAAMAAIQNTR